MSRKRGIAALLAVLVVAPGAAWGAGQITGVVANPSSTLINQPVTVTVQGTGTCSQVVVRCQAPAAPEHVKLNIALPFAVTCTYSSTGTKTVTASAELPNADCPGDKITQVTVNQKVIIDPKVLVYVLQPHIDNMLIFSKPSPGGAVIVLGKNFGSQPGKLQIVGEFGTKDLVDLDWGSDGKFVGGKVPDNICGVHNHPAKLVVTTKAGAKSNEFPVTFLAKKEWKWLKPNDINLVNCSDDANENHCNGVDAGGDWYVAPQPFSSGPGFEESIYGYHYNCWGCIGNDSGTDKYQVTLANGWTFSGLLLEEHDPGSEGDVNGPTPGFPSGASSWAPQWGWMATSDDYVWYAAAIEIEGDCGVPYK
jgi:hypothetical protein